MYIELLSIFFITCFNRKSKFDEAELEEVCTKVMTDIPSRSDFNTCLSYLMFGFVAGVVERSVESSAVL